MRDRANFRRPFATASWPSAVLAASAAQRRQAASGTDMPAFSVFAGCDFEGDERRVAKTKREALHANMHARGHDFVVRRCSEHELQRGEFLGAVDDDTLDLLKEYIFSGRA